MMKIFADTQKNKFEFESFLKDDDQIVIKNGTEITYDMVSLGDGRYSLIKENKSYLVHLIKKEESYHVHVLGDLFDVHVEDERVRKVKELVEKSAGAPAGQVIKAPIPGLVVKVNVKAGQEVMNGDGLLVLEAMKMENIIKAPYNCLVTEVAVKENTTVQQGQVLIKIKSLK
ncbi:MAG: biotin/lipoyl-containing protein [Calditrichaceae bacterium]